MIFILIWVVAELEEVLVVIINNKESLSTKTFSKIRMFINSTLVQSSNSIEGKKYGQFCSMISQSKNLEILKKNTRLLQQKCTESSKLVP